MIVDPAFENSVNRILAVAPKGGEIVIRDGTFASGATGDAGSFFGIAISSDITLRAVNPGKVVIKIVNPPPSPPPTGRRLDGLHEAEEEIHSDLAPDRHRLLQAAATRSTVYIRAGVVSLQ